MKACSIDLYTGRVVNNCGSARCPLCLNRKMKSRKRKLVCKFIDLENQGNKLIAVTIEPDGIPTDNKLDLTESIFKMAGIKRALVRRYAPEGHYFQTEFSSCRNMGDSNLLAPHCHGIMAVPSSEFIIGKEATYIAIKGRTIQLKHIYDLENWVGYTLKEIQHPPQLSNMRIKLFSQSRDNNI